VNFYDLLPYVGIPKRIIQDLQKYKFDDPTPYFHTSSFWYAGQGNGKSTWAAHILAEAMRNDPIRSGWKSALEKLDPKSDEWNRYYEPRFNYHFCWWPKFLERIKTTFSKSYTGPSESYFIQQCIEAYVLVLDDIGVEMSTDWAYQMLYLIIGERYNEMRPTIITSNLSLQKLGDKFQDTRIPSRIEGMCQGHIYKMQGKDYRKSSFKT
jgi:DNA replication protein DnaC